MWKWFWILGLAAVWMAGAATPVRAEGETAGQKAFVKLKCNQCHAVSAVKIELVKDETEEEEAADEEETDPPDLSGVGKERDSDWIAKWLKKEVKVEGRKHKKKFKGSDEEMQAISVWLASLKSEAPKKGK